ncbi:hypothetical protein [Bradyrhizobium sp. HKCCYLR20261]|uniref:hypothetical protein n=1 Tax=unclassified Bradyrhizobium TaxID=2631580 RepID=UPI003EC062AD
MTNPQQFQAVREQGPWRSAFEEGVRPVAPIQLRRQCWTGPVILIKTKGAHPENTIALKRCHIAFGRSWTGEWQSYIEHFRYLILRPESDLKPQWTHDRQPADEQSATVPFLNKEAREGWRQRARKMGHPYE